MSKGQQFAKNVLKRRFEAVLTRFRAISAVLRLFSATQMKRLWVQDEILCR
jgi:hypothetical protein